MEQDGAGRDGLKWLFCFCFRMLLSWLAGTVLGMVPVQCTGICSCPFAAPCPGARDGARKKNGMVPGMVPETVRGTVLQHGAGNGARKNDCGARKNCGARNSK